MSTFDDLHLLSFIWDPGNVRHSHTHDIYCQVAQKQSIQIWVEWICWVKSNVWWYQEGKVQALAEVVFQGIAPTLVWHQQLAEIMFKRQYCRVHLKIRGLQIHWFPARSFTMIIAWDATSNGHPSFSKRHPVQFCSGKVGWNFSGRGRKSCTLENQHGTWTRICPPLEKTTFSSYTGRHVYNGFLTAPYT